MSEKIVLKLKLAQSTVEIPEGKPVLVRWKSKNKDRPGLNTGIGWIRRGENSHQIELIHRAFSTWDGIETEYASRWTVWVSQIIDIRVLKKIG